MTRISHDEIDALRLADGEAKPRPRGTLPYLPDTEDPDVLRGFLGLAFRPRPDWHVHDFERAGRAKTDPCTLVVRNGREQRRFRFSQQRELLTTMRLSVLAVADGDLRMPHLTATEVEDTWAALCQLGRVLSEYDETDETRKWVEWLVTDATTMQGLSLVPDHRHDALMAMRARGEFLRPDALAFARAPIAERVGLRRPLRFIDAQTGEQFVRSGELATYLRHVQGVDSLSHNTLRSRLSEIGVERKSFEAYQPPHPKLTLYGLTGELVEFADVEGSR